MGRFVNGKEETSPVWESLDYRNLLIARLEFKSTVFEGNITIFNEPIRVQSKEDRELVIKAIKKLIKVAYKNKTIKSVLKATRSKEDIQIAGKKEEAEMILENMDIILATGNEVFADDIDRAGIDWYAEEERGVGVTNMQGVTTYYFRQNVKRYLSRKNAGG